MNQTTMFDTDPSPAQYDNNPLPPQAQPEKGEARARRGDPESSKAAAAEMNASGAANRQRQQVIDAVWKWPGRTSKELAKLDGEVDRHAFGRRLPEAEEAGEVYRVKEGTAELRWWPGVKP